jgi:CheY-like chemotaxis protein
MIELPPLRILMVEDKPNWRREVPDLLEGVRGIGANSHVDLATNYGEGLVRVADVSYDLAIIDLALLGDPADPRDSDQLGMDLLRVLRESRRNRGCGLIVLTGYPTTERTRQALRDYAAFDFIEKDKFKDDEFVITARAAIRDAYLKQAVAKASARYRLTITFGREHLIGCELAGPDRRASYAADAPLRFEVEDLARRADNLDLLIRRGGYDMWRPEARAIGEILYKTLANDHRILGDLVAARALAERFSDLWLQFSGPPVGLGVPFELLHDQDAPLCLSHILTRRVAQAGATFSRKPEPFQDFLKGISDGSEQLRILFVGANSDGAIPSAEQEARDMAVMVKTSLERLGIHHAVDLLVGDDASYSRVREAFREGRHHVLHYAGHGWHAKASPELSGLVLRDGSGIRLLTAADLNLLARDTALRLIYLSCCLGARTAAQVGRGDFHGTLEALVRADIPYVLGYRWTVADTTAARLAAEFYHSLWRTFSPGEALLHARREISLEPQGRDDETWASPVLVAQNA